MMRLPALLNREDVYAYSVCVCVFVCVCFSFFVLALAPNYVCLVGAVGPVARPGPYRYWFQNYKVLIFVAVSDEPACVILGLFRS